MKTEVRGQRSEVSTELPFSNFELPVLRNTEDAIAFGRHMTRDQYIFLEGAKAALRRMYESARLESRYVKDPGKLTHLVQLRADLAFQGQLIREAQEVVPDLVLAAILKADIATRNKCPHCHNGQHDDHGDCIHCRGTGFVPSLSASSAKSAVHSS